MVDDPREAEVEHLHVAVGADHDVFGLDVAVDDAGGVRRGQRARHLPPDVNRRRERLRALDERPQRPPVDELLDDEELAVRRLADFVDGDDVGVVEGRGRARLAQEALDQASDLRRGPCRISLTATGRFSRVSNAAEHLAHAATADASVDAVVPERGRSHP